MQETSGSGLGHGVAPVWTALADLLWRAGRAFRGQPARRSCCRFAAKEKESVSLHATGYRSLAHGHGHGHDGPAEPTPAAYASMQRP